MSFQKIFNHGFLFLDKFMATVFFQKLSKKPDFSAKRHQGALLFAKPVD